MANLSKERRDRMIAKLEELKTLHSDDESIMALNEIENALKEKKFGLVFEEHTEAVDEMLVNNIPVFTADPERRLCKDAALPWNFVVEGDNLQALYLLQKTHKGKVDCIYIDPPYNTGAHDWKYNNDYVDDNDSYRHSKWLSMMRARLAAAHELLNPESSFMIVTIDEKEYMHLGCLLEEMFPEANMQMVCSVIKNGTSMRQYEFSRCNEYIYFLRFGNAVIGKEIPENVSTSLPWRPLMRSGTGTNNFRPARPNSFYPIWINQQTGKVQEVGDPVLPATKPRQDVEQIPGCIPMWPLDSEGRERVWGASADTLKKYLEQGFARLTKSRGKFNIQYITTGVIKDIENGNIEVTGRDEYGGICGAYLEGKSQMPQNQWDIQSHNATSYGTNLLKDIIGDRFTFPKSLYAVHDCIRYAVKDKKDAIIVDFFAGSGTTMHAVNLLNAEDGGHRKCIIVTNNEIGEELEAQLAKQGVVKGDPDWEKYGIARYVTWPRVYYSALGKNYRGEQLKGAYIGKDIPMENGFETNIKYYRCDWVSRNPEEGDLFGALIAHITEMIEIEHHIEVDGKNYLIILDEDQADEIEHRWADYHDLKGIYISKSVLLTTTQNELFYTVPVNTIPDYYFNIEMREVGESW